MSTAVMPGQVRSPLNCRGSNCKVLGEDAYVSGPGRFEEDRMRQMRAELERKREVLGEPPSRHSLHMIGSAGRL